MKVEIAYGSLRERGIFVPLSLLGKVVNSNAHRSHYFSYFAHESQNKVANHIPFRCVLDYEIADIHKTDPFESAVKTVPLVAKHLQSDILKDEDVWIWFTGNAGWHVEFPNRFRIENGESSPDLLRYTLEEYFADDGLDLSPCKRRGMIRAPYSRHATSKLHKIPIHPSRFHPGITLEEAATLVHEVREAARAVTRKPLPDYESWANAKKKFAPVVISSKSKPSLTTQHTYVRGQPIGCLSKLHEKGPVKGSRHQQMILLASYCFYSGLRFETALAEGRAFLAGKVSDNELNDLLQPVYNVYYKKPYQYSCKHSWVQKQGICTHYNRCPFKGRREFIKKIDSMEDIKTRIQQRITWRKEGFIIDIQKMLSLETPFLVYPQQSIIITGDTGMGKSAFTDYLLLRSGLKVLKFNTELGDIEQTLRLICSYRGVNEETAEEMVLEYIDGNHSLLADRFTVIHGNTTTDEIKALTIEHKPQVLYVDTTENIDDHVRDNYSRQRMVMKGLNEFAKDNDIILVAVHHIRKRQTTMDFRTGEAKVQKNITLHDLEGARQNVTQFRHVFTVEGAKESSFRDIICLKSNSNAVFKTRVETIYDKWQFKF